MRPVIRRATADDLPQIAALFSQSRRLLTFLPELHSVEEDRGFIAGLLSSADVRVALAADGRPIAMLVEDGDWIDHLYVAPDAIGTGAGSALLADAQARHDQLQLWCFADNLRARHFYEARGFVIAETTDGAGNEARLPDIRYVWSRA
ncbi:MAG: GNAT family N-acetyltransferase [Hyphomicrobiales bacterium]|nr:MAG: GNAT family N-acetyltransferase [Hyphomicrobiales bacterium]